MVMLKVRVIMKVMLMFLNMMFRVIVIKLRFRVVSLVICSFCVLLVVFFMIICVYRLWVMVDVLVRVRFDIMVRMVVKVMVERKFSSRLFFIVWVRCMIIMLFLFSSLFFVFLFLKNWGCWLMIMIDVRFSRKMILKK